MIVAFTGALTVRASHSDLNEEKRMEVQLLVIHAGAISAKHKV